MPVLAGVELDAISVAGLETSICLPRFDCALDMGVCRPAAVHRSTVLFTHAHIDHLGAVARHCATRGLYGLKPPTYAIPEESIPATEALLAAWRRLDGSAMACTLLPARPGTEVSLGKGRYARALRSIHRVPSLAWVVFEIRQKLKPEWQGRPGAEIAAARRTGAAVTDRTDVPLLAFTGDSRVEVLDREPLLREARLLVMEVSFVDDQVSVERARAMGHIHLDEVVERADRFHNEALLFTHRSDRYSPAGALERIRERLPAGLRERVWVLPHERAFRDTPPAPVPVVAQEGDPHE